MNRKVSASEEELIIIIDGDKNKQLDEVEKNQSISFVNSSYYSYSFR